MKRPLHLLLTVLTFFFVQHSFSQAICGFDIMHARKMKQDPVYRKNVLASENSIREYIRQHPVLAPPPRTIKITSGNPPTTSGNPINLGGPPYTIPVVVNVINTGDPIGSIDNPTDAQIEGAIAYLNAVYSGTYPGMDNANGAGNMQIQFVLAQRDPNCNPTNGINRVDGSGVAGYVSGGVNSATTLGTNDVNIKNLSRWDPTQYYNVWIVNKIDGNDGTSGQFIAGYAYFPGSSPLEDGIVMLATQMVAGQKTLPHEIGHAFNLFHPFEGSTDASVCPANANCSMDGDQVCDTDPISENINSGTGVIDFTCRTGTNTCTTTPYSPKTESNFMNYTLCYTLFTAGQAARMQASANTSRSGLTTSLGGTAPSGGGCSTPKIDFELSGDQQTETTTATLGCRNYKDYSYNMIIGAGPSTAATATINVVSGTAKQGLDFDITTNGSFTPSSQQLNFAAGSTSSQPFTIRVYDDASVNGTRSVTLGFTVNNGGGNAVAGDGRPHFTMIINDNDLAPTAGIFPVGSTIIGPASVGFASSPFDASQTSERSQFLYKASELTAAGIPAGPISGLSIQVNAKNSVRPFTNFNIKLGTSSSSFLVNTTGLTYGSSMTIVKSLASYATTTGWNNFTFDIPYIWDGTSNIVVEICYDNGSAAPSDAGDKVVFYVDGGAGQGNAIFQESIDCSEPFTGSAFVNSGTTGFKPRITFAYGTPATIVQTALITSQSQYLGPNADVYFYDPTNSQLMAHIQNMSSFDYGCTQVVIDRAGTNAAQFWNSNIPNYLLAKTFHVLPTNNNSSGSYKITLFYTQAEVNGWQTVTGQNISAAQLVKVPSEILNVTAANPTGGGLVTIGSPTISTLGTNTSLTFNFTNGFSGFGAGVPGSATLPVGLLDFGGQRQGAGALLTWTTSYEQGSKGFEIDRSGDGNNFSQIGYVTAAGNSILPLHYSFTDPTLAQGNNFYRLKQIDLDDKFTYSNIVLMQGQGSATAGFVVLSNPFFTSLDILFGQIPAGNVQIRLLDLTGREILRQSAMQSSGSHLHIDVSPASLSAGVYLLEARFAGQVLVQKVMKQ